MVKALFDTNILVDYLKGFPQAQRELALYDDCAISILTWMEVMIGAAPDVVVQTRHFLDSFEVAALDNGIAEGAVRLRQKHRLKLPDAIIWATADAVSGLLVTRNTKDFPANMPGVRIPYAL